jgi:hypothetical protein
VRREAGAVDSESASFADDVAVTAFSGALFGADFIIHAAMPPAPTISDAKPIFTGRSQVLRDALICSSVRTDASKFECAKALASTSEST